MQGLRGSLFPLLVFLLAESTLMECTPVASMEAVGRTGQSLIKSGRRMVLSAVTPGCPLGSVNRPGLWEGPPPAFVRPRLQSAAADLVITLLKRISRWPQ